MRDCTRKARGARTGESVWTGPRDQSELVPAQEGEQFGGAAEDVKANILEVRTEGKQLRTHIAKLGVHLSEVRCSNIEVRAQVHGESVRECKERGDNFLTVGGEGLSEGRDENPSEEQSKVEEEAAWKGDKLEMNPHAAVASSSPGRRQRVKTKGREEAGHKDVDGGQARSGQNRQKEDGRAPIKARTSACAGSSRSTEGEGDDDGFVKPMRFLGRTLHRNVSDDTAAQYDISP